MVTPKQQSSSTEPPAHGAEAPHTSSSSPSEAEALSVPEIMHKATDLLHGIRPQPPAVIIAQILGELKDKLTPRIEPADMPKNLEEGIAKIEELVGKLAEPPKQKPDFKAVMEQMTAKPPPPVEAEHAKEK